MKTVLTVTISVLTTLLLFASNASATLKSSFGLSVKEDYNNNIYLTENNEEDDYITKISPSIGLEFSSGRHKASLKYSYEWQDYADNSKADDGTHRGKLKITSIVVERLLTLNLSDVYEKVNTDTRRSSNEDEVLVNTVEKNTFTFNPVIHRDLSQVTTISGGYEFIDVDYNNDTSEDVQYNKIYVMVDRSFSERLKGSAKYSHDKKDTQDDMTEDFTTERASLSASLQLTEATSFTATAGRSWYDYDIRTDTEESFWAVTAKSMVAGFADTSLSYRREAKDSPELGTYMTELASARLSFGNRFKVTLGASTKEDEYLTSAREDDVVSGDATLAWKITQKLLLTVNGRLSNEKFTLPAEEVDKWSAGVLARYRLGRHFDVSANYKRTDRDSTVTGNSYTNDVYTLSLLASY